MKSVTVDDVIRWDVCYHRNRIEELEKQIKGHEHIPRGFDVDAECIMQNIGKLNKRVEVLENQPRITEITSTHKPHTCGDCRFPWRKEGHGSICYKRNKGKGDSRCVWIGDSTLACEKFQPREEPCTD